MGFHCISSGILTIISLSVSVLVRFNVSVSVSATFINAALLPLLAILI